VIASLTQAAPVLWLLLAVALEIGGTYLLKLSDGMARRGIGAGGIVLVMGAFAALAKAIEGMDLSVAYAVWGGAGLVITAVIGALVFGQRIRPVGWVGILLVCGVAALKMI
jgi:spermidine export protein MdtI